MAAGRRRRSDSRSSRRRAGDHFPRPACNAVGRLMTPDFIAVHEDWTVQHVLDYVREFGHDSETLNILYVVDDHNKLIDDVRMREFLLRPLSAKVSEIRDQNFAALKVTDSQ